MGVIFSYLKFKMKIGRIRMMSKILNLLTLLVMISDV